MKVAELTLDQLDYWVARANGITVFEPAVGQGLHYQPNPQLGPRRWTPSRFWSQGGPILEEAHVDLNWNTEGTQEWSASLDPDILMHGASPLEAAMRAVVASRFGLEVGG